MVSDFFFFGTFTQIPIHLANSGDPDQTRHSAASDLCLHHLQMSAKCLWILNLKGVSFVLFERSLQKILGPVV